MPVDLGLELEAEGFGVGGMVDLLLDVVLEAFSVGIHGNKINIIITHPQHNHKNNCNKDEKEDVIDNSSSSIDHCRM